MSIFKRIGLRIQEKWNDVKTTEKESSDTLVKPENQRDEPQSLLAIEQTVSLERLEDVKKSLRILDVEKQIARSALNTLDKCLAANQITKDDYAALSDKYEKELDTLERRGITNQEIIRLYDLEEAQRRVVQEFHQKIREIKHQLDAIRAMVHASQATEQAS